MTKEQAQHLYRNLCDRADRILRRWNPCKIQLHGSSGERCALSCTHSGGQVVWDGVWCCQGCKYLGPQGCTVLSLGCKLWLCSIAKEKHPIIHQRLELLRAIALECGLPVGYRTSFEDDFQEGRLAIYEQKKFIPLREVRQ